MSKTLSVVGAPRGDRTRAPCLHVGIAGDDPRTPPARIGLHEIDTVTIERGDRRQIQRDGRHITLVLADPQLSRHHARLERVGPSWVVEDLNSKNGTRVCGHAPTRDPLDDGDTILIGHTMLIFRDTGGDAPDLDRPEAAQPGFATMSPALADRFDELARAAQSTVPIEIVGETGTGKELAARAIHVLSRRRGAFIAVNCGALPTNLLEAELFGHRKGAFTGAISDRTGFVRSADKGTLFLDEVAELPTTSQAALLRVLQEHEVTPVGDDRPIAVDIRVVTAAHRPLDVAVSQSKFRDDLRARLLGVMLELPPLRERREDLAMLVAVLLDRIAPTRKLSLSADAVAQLYAHDWRLNIRELEHSLAAAVATAPDRIEASHLPAPRTAAPVDVRGLDADETGLRSKLAEAIERHAGNLAAVAREMGKDRTQIRRWMKRFGLGRQ